MNDEKLKKIITAYYTNPGTNENWQNFSNVDLRENTNENTQFQKTERGKERTDDRDTVLSDPESSMKYRGKQKELFPTQYTEIPSHNHNHNLKPSRLYSLRAAVNLKKFFLSSRILRKEYFWIGGIVLFLLFIFWTAYVIFIKTPLPLGSFNYEVFQSSDDNLKRWILSNKNDPLSKEQITSGFFTTEVFGQQKEIQISLDFLENVLKNTALARDLLCLSAFQLGIPQNIIFLSNRDVPEHITTWYMINPQKDGYGSTIFYNDKKTGYIIREFKFSHEELNCIIESLILSGDLI